MNYQDLFDNQDNSRKFKKHSQESCAKIKANTPQTAEIRAKRQASKLRYEQEVRQGLRSKAGHNTPGRVPQKIVTPLGTFDNIKLATVAHGHKSCSSIKQKIQKYPDQYFYVTKGE
jgi:hypothetical protein